MREHPRERERCHVHPALLGLGPETVERVEDCVVDEPLPAESPLWGMDHVLITPHTAGETRAYEDNVLDCLMENLERLWRGETELRNQVV